MSLVENGKIKNTDQKVDEEKYEKGYEEIKWKSNRKKKPTKGEAQTTRNAL